jgi:hypothetical protein
MYIVMALINLPKNPTRSLNILPKVKTGTTKERKA